MTIGFDVFTRGVKINAIFELKMDKKRVIIFGGSGFIGSELSKSLIESHEVCVACTNPKRAEKNIGLHENLTISTPDITSKDELEALVKDCDIVINLIGKLFESRKGDFDKFHHQFPKLLSQVVDSSKLLIHVSSLGVENSSATSLYASTKLKGEEAIRENSENYNIIKPSVVFGKRDNFFNLFARMSKLSPFLPLIGGGGARFAPVYVQDVVGSIVAIIHDPAKYKNQTFEAFGPIESSFKEVMEFILATKSRKRLLLNLPYKLATVQAKVMNAVKIYALTADQVELLKYDNIATGLHESIETLGVNLKSYTDIVPAYI